MLKKFFGINESYKFEWCDLSAILTLANVVLIIAGFWWAPIVGIINAVINLVLAVINHGHINGYVINLALIVLNIYFLK